MPNILLKHVARIRIFRDMAIGFMEVQLVKAKGLRDTDIFGKMDPYVLIQYKGQEKRSGVANGQGKNPVWNEKFIFKVEYPGSSNQHKLILKIMDKDLYTDDFVGEAIIHVGDLLAQGVENGGAKLQTLKYRVVRANKSYCGEIDVGVTFTRKVEDKFVEEDIGGWKESDHYLLVVRANNSYCGEIDVGVTFTPQVEEEIVKEDIGGWKESGHCLPQISKAKI
ncbi:Elicitor-responsive protein 1 [Glycine soja]